MIDLGFLEGLLLLLNSPLFRVSTNAAYILTTIYDMAAGQMWMLNLLIGNAQDVSASGILLSVNKLLRASSGDESILNATGLVAAIVSALFSASLSVP